MPEEGARIRSIIFLGISLEGAIGGLILGRGGPPKDSGRIDPRISSAEGFSEGGALVCSEKLRPKFRGGLGLEAITPAAPGAWAKGWFSWLSSCSA